MWGAVTTDKEDAMNTTVDEVADGIFRLSTWIPDITDKGCTFRCRFAVISPSNTWPSATTRRCLC